LTKQNVRGVFPPPRKQATSKKRAGKGLGFPPWLKKKPLFLWRGGK